MTAQFRLTRSADDDVLDILAWSHETFGEVARQRYERLMVAAILHAAELKDGPGFRARPDLGAGVFTWHLAQSSERVAGGRVTRPRHFLVCRWDGQVMVVGRILHDSMDPGLHLAQGTEWE